MNTKRNLSSKETKRTIIMLSAKRCGSTAVFRMFQKHSDVGVCHINQLIENWEPRFWDLAGRALQGEKKPFIKRLKKSHPYLKIPATFSETEIFQLWDSILERLGPIVFDKSPQYLGNRTALELIYKYKVIGNDVRIFAFIRDPRDAITSQYILFGGDSPEKREVRWLKKYRHLEELEQRYETIPLFRYEDFSQSPSVYAPVLLKLCSLHDYPHSYNHIRPINIGRYSISDNTKIRKWKFSEEFIVHLKKHGYSIPQKL